MSIKLAPIAVLALFFAPLATSAPTTLAPVVQDSDSDDSDEQSYDCPHTGAEWVDPKAINTGAAQCTSVTFKLEIGVNQGGASVTASFNGCPSFVDTKPGHSKKVGKLHHRAVNPQNFNYTRQKYKADCGGWFSNPSCTPVGGPANLPQVVKSWDEEACDL